MRLITCCLVLVSAVFLIGCKNEESSKSASKPTAQPSVPEPTPSKTNVRDPNSDKEDIVGKWKSRDKDATQFEFTATELTIRPASGEAKTVPFTLRNEIRPSQIDWGNGADAVYGLYTLDGKNLIIDYNTGSPESRPKKPGKAPTHKQVWLEKVE